MRNMDTMKTDVPSTKRNMGSSFFAASEDGHWFSGLQSSPIQQLSDITCAVMDPSCMRNAPNRANNIKTTGLQFIGLKIEPCFYSFLFY